MSRDVKIVEAIILLLRDMCSSNLLHFYLFFFFCKIFANQINKRKKLFEYMCHKFY